MIFSVSYISRAILHIYSTKIICTWFFALENCFSSISFPKFRRALFFSRPSIFRIGYRYAWEARTHASRAVLQSRTQRGMGREDDTIERGRGKTIFRRWESRSDDKSRSTAWCLPPEGSTFSQRRVAWPSRSWWGGVARRVGSGRVISSHAVAWREFARARRIESRGSTSSEGRLLNLIPRFIACPIDSSLLRISSALSSFSFPLILRTRDIMIAADERVIHDRNGVLINGAAASESRSTGRAESLWHPSSQFDF